MRICSIPNCNQKHYGRTWCRMHYIRWRKYNDPYKVARNQALGKLGEDQFWHRINKGREDECWEWQGYIETTGYGACRYEGKTVKSHRMAWFYTYGEWPKFLMLHKCDNPPCCNPNHLWDGTAKENTADMINKNRHSWSDGKHPNAKLTVEQVKEIKYNTTQLKLKEVSEKYSIGLSTVSFIRTGRSWGWV